VFIARGRSWGERGRGRGERRKQKAESSENLRRQAAGGRNGTRFEISALEVLPASCLL
jgi:hypothetical protein